MPKDIRLNKFIASAEDVSRRKADELIAAGKIKINGKVVSELGTCVSGKERIEISGSKIVAKSKKYIIFYKPPGYITTKTDPEGRKTIYDLIPENLQHLKTVGRLDRASSGLLILTNDGDLIQALTHPKLEVPKVYRVAMEGKVTLEDLHKFAKGIEIEPGKTAYADSTIIDQSKEKTTLEMTLYQGYNRQIRKMADIVGHPVISLKRVTHGNLTLTGLDKGKYRFLSSQEVSELRNYLRNIRKIVNKKQNTTANRK